VLRGVTYATVTTTVNATGGTANDVGRTGMKPKSAGVNQYRTKPTTTTTATAIKQPDVSIVVRMGI
jgi:hypothetical protein